MSEIKPEIFRFDQFKDLESALVDELCASIQRGLQQQQKITYLLSGGKTPQAIYKKLGQKDLPWEQIHFQVTDERCVHWDHPERNERMLFEKLGAQAHNSLRNFIDRDANCKHTDELLLHAETVYAATAPVFGMLLGFGDDGHIASIFPDESRDLSVKVEESQNFTVCKKQQDDFLRLSINWDVIKKAPELVVLACGERKFNLIATYMESKLLPLNQLLQSKPVKIFWSREQAVSG